MTEVTGSVVLSMNVDGGVTLRLWLRSRWYQTMPTKIDESSGQRAYQGAILRSFRDFAMGGGDDYFFPWVFFEKKNEAPNVAYR
jgi:hypothetical protein